MAVPIKKSSDPYGLALRAATIQPKSVNPEARTVDVMWSTGVRVRQRDWDGAYYEELDMSPGAVRLGRLNNGAPFLADHNRSSIANILGVIKPGSARIENGQGLATIRFPKAEDDPEADKVFRKIQDGIITSVSVGNQIYKLEKQPQVKGELPVYRAVDWEPFELSAVPCPAEDGAGFRALAVHGSNAMTEEEKRAAAEKAAQDAVRAAELKAFEETRRAADLKVAAEGERLRITGITLACRTAKLDQKEIDVFIASDKTADQVRTLMLEKLYAESEKTEIDNHQKQPAIEVGTTEREKSLRGAEAAMIQRYGMFETVRAMQEKVKTDIKLSARAANAFRDVATDPGEFAGMRPSRIAQEFLERAGKSTRGWSDDKIVEQALSLRGSAGEQTTSDFTALLQNIMYKQFLGQYELADATWKEFCFVDSVQDFRPSNRFRSGTMGPVQAKTEANEFQNIVVPDGLKQVINAQTKGGIFNVSREALVNDDMGAILSTIGQAGDSAGLAIELDVYTLLTANSGLGANFATPGNPAGSTPFFNANNSNVNATGSALSVEALEADRIVMAQQKDLNNNWFLNIRPSVLLVPVGLGGYAKVINRMEYSDDSSVFQRPNMVRGLFNKVIDTPRLSGTRRYLFSDKVKAIVVAFLNGERSPFMEQRLGFRIDGTEIKIRIDYGTQFFDAKGAVTNAGA